MPEEWDCRPGEIVRRNRHIARIQRITPDRVHLRILSDFSFRVFESEVIELEKAPVLLRRFPQGYYSCILFQAPEKIESIREENALELMRLILLEHETPFGKREFKQVLVADDGVVSEEGWNRFWNAAARAMRASGAFSVDARGRYVLA